MKIKKLYEPVFSTHLLIIYDGLEKEILEYFEKKGINIDISQCSGATGRYTVKKEGYSRKEYYIFIAKKRSKDLKKISVLVHEIAHLIFMSLHDCGIYIDDRNDETYAYYFEWWFDKLMPYFK